MKTSDIVQVILVVIVFVVLMFANVATAGIDRVKKNWPLYRCRPTIMPFASMFGHDTTSNFSYCISNMMSQSMDMYTAPIKQTMAQFTSGGVPSMTGGAPGGPGGGMLGSMGSSNNASRGMFSGLRDGMGGMVKSITGIFVNLLIEMQKIGINMQDMMGKLVATVATLMFMIKSAVQSLNAVWKGPPGELMRGLCFDPLTKLRMEDGQLRCIGEVSPGDRLRGGVRVCAVMDISNMDENGRQIEMMYSLPAGEDNNNVLVSGSHLVYDEGVGGFTPVRNLDHALTGAAMTSLAAPRLTCLITSDHTIPIGRWVFHDWEDNNGSKSKTLG